MFSDALQQEAQHLLKAAREKEMMIATAESCTGGLIAGLLTDIAGSSDVFERGFVTYSNQAKQQMLGVPHALLSEHGAVSEEVVRAMAEGALKYSDAHLSVAVTGIAGPGGGSELKPVGLVHIACACIGKGTVAEHHIFDGNRHSVREHTVRHALIMLGQAIK